MTPKRARTLAEEQRRLKWRLWNFIRPAFPILDFVCERVLHGWPYGPGGHPGGFTAFGRWRYGIADGPLIY